jgi:hypothetical protein
MPTFTNPSEDAEEAREALRGLAHATRLADDPSEVYTVLGSVTAGLASLTQVLHQLGQFHDAHLGARASVAGDPRAGRAASYQVSWELHRAAEMVHQVADGVARAHQVEATITYDTRDACRVRTLAPGLVSDPNPIAASRPVRDSGRRLSL